jgi:hypothetical protein
MEPPFSAWIKEMMPAEKSWGELRKTLVLETVNMPLGMG